MQLRHVAVPVVGLVCLVAAADAQAQPPQDWIVVRTAPRTDPPGVTAAADSLQRRLVRERSVLDREKVTELIVQRHSAEVRAATPDDIDALASESQQAREHVAFGRLRQARASVRRALERAQGALETLNRQTRSARQVLNSCFYLVRALEEAGDRERALQQAVQCVRLVPDMTPSVSEHPPEVRQLHAEAVAHIESGPHGSLQVESDPEGCAVYLNGRELGSTPFERAHLPTGEYRVQVECGGRAGRVHRVILPAEPRELVVDWRLDVALRTAGGDVWLRYADAELERRWRLPHALRVAGIVDARHVLLVAPQQGGVLRADHVDVERGGVVASVWLAYGDSGLAPADSSRAVEHLLAGRSVDLSGEVERTREPWAPPAQARRRASATEASGGGDAELASDANATEVPSADGDLRWLGWTLAGVGAASYVTAWALQGVWLDRHDRAQKLPTDDPRYLKAVNDRDALDLPVALLAAVGAAAATSSMPMLMGGDGAAWWHWVVGAAGAVGIAAGAGIWAREGQCVDDTCANRYRRVPLGPLVVLSAAPLVAVPVMAVLSRGGSEDELAGGGEWMLAPSASPQGGGVHLRARW